MGLTEEQQAVVEDTSQLLAVQAFAGTGKTTTLIAYANHRPRKKILYLAFNRARAEEARGKLPPHARALTLHGLAFRHTGVVFQHKLTGSVKPLQVLSAFDRRPPFSSWPRLVREEKLLLADLAIRAVVAFTYSAHEDLNQIPMPANPFGADQVTLAAQHLWERMIDPNDREVPIHHDGYFKLFQKQHPDLSVDYDLILLDEAQDTNPALLALLLEQAIPCVLVGDTHQNIYSFRGAVNALAAVRKQAKHLALTGAFRFGEAIASVAKCVLETFLGEKRPIRGLGPPGQVSQDLDAELTTAFLFRTNAGLFDQAARLAWKNQGAYFQGGLESYRLGEILDTYRLHAGQHAQIQSPFIRAFPSFQALRDYAQQVDDVELKVRLQVVEHYGRTIPKWIAKIEQLAVLDPAYPIVLSTVHKAKGGEWPQVVLGEDFPETTWNGKPKTASVLANYLALLDPLDPEEARILYVAITRAKNRLVPNRPLRELLNATAN
ncbi:MAG: UvrD-helicase domain-containing protein [Methylohalobius sp.]|nr:UvrD-helicase domain-containing protein [Methylohalobius sp.]